MILRLFHQDVLSRYYKRTNLWDMLRNIKICYETILRSEIKCADCKVESGKCERRVMYASNVLIYLNIRLI